MADFDPTASLAEQRIKRAMEDGAFDDLPGKGEPLPDLDGTYDPKWWVKKFIERENLSKDELRALLEAARKETG